MHILLVHTNGGNDVGQDVVLGALLGQRLGEANHGQLGGRVVGLAKAAKQTGGRGSVDDPAVLLLAEVRPGGTRALVGAGDVHLDDQVPVLVLEVLEGNVAQDAGVVDEDVDAAKGLDGRLDDALAVLDAVVVGNGLAAGLFDFVDDDISGLEIKIVSRSAYKRQAVHCVVGSHGYFMDTSWILHGYGNGV